MRVKRNIALCCVGVLAAVAGCISKPDHDTSSDPPFRFSHEICFDECGFSAAVLGSNGAFFVGSRDACRLIDLRRRRVVWERRLPKAAGGAHLLLDGHTLYAHLSEACITALDTRTGRPLWEVDSPVFSHPLALDGGLLFCQLNTNDLVALNTGDGTCTWRAFIPSLELQYGPETPYMIGAPVICSNAVVVGLCDGRVMALRRDDGGIIWQFTLPESATEISFIDDVLRAGSNILIRSYSRTSGTSVLTALDLGVGHIQWKLDVDARTIAYEAPLCFAATRSNLLCIAAESGEILWSSAYERQSEDVETTRTDPVLRFHREGVLVASGARVYLFARDGRPMWDWTSRTAWSWCPPVLDDDFLAVVDWRRIVFFEPGSPDALPTTQRRREALARSIVQRLDALSCEDERKLDLLGGEAVPALVAEFKRLTPVTEDTAFSQIEKLSKCERYIEQYAQAQHSNLLTEVYGHDPFSGQFALDVLCKQGCQVSAAMLALDTLRRGTGESRLVDLVTQTDHPKLTDFLAEVMRKRQPEYLLNEAYANLARNGTKEQVELVTGIQKQAQRGVLVSTKAQMAEWEMKGTSEDVERDTDGDGWSDGLEQRFGTDPKSADSDGDGQVDSQDWNPLATPFHDLTQEELVLQAAFDARFRFTGSKELCIVVLPDGARTIEFTGRDWVTLCFAGKLPPFVADGIGKGAATVSFGKGSMVHWSSDRTEATVNIRTYFGPLAATGYQVTVRKIGESWVPIRCVMIWIS